MKIEKFEGDLFWDHDDPEMNIDPEEYMYEVGCGRVVQFSHAKSLPGYVFGVEYYDAAEDEYKCEFFTTREEAEAFNAEKDAERDACATKTALIPADSGD